MTTYSIIQLSQLEGASRFDAEYYQQEYLHTKNHLLSIPHYILGQHAFITDGEHGSVEFIDDGIKYLTAENIQEGFMDLENIRFVSDAVDKRNRRASLLPDDITLSIKGTVGLAALTFKEDLPANMNRDVSRIHVKDNMDPYFLTIFLNSKYGKGQALRESSGNVQQMITLGRIRELLIPKAAPEITSVVKELYLKSHEELINANKYYSQAENLLLEELGLQDYKAEDDLYYIVDLSDTESAHRFDADYFQPKYDILISKLKSQNSKPLLEIVENVSARFNPKPDENYHYVELSNINSSIGIIDGFSEISGKDAPSRARRLLEAGDVIVSSVEGSFDKVAMVGKENVDSLASTGFFQFLSKTILSEVLLVLAKSIIIKMQLQKQTAGTILTAVPNDALKNILIPLLPNSTQQKIADLVRKSHDSRKKSKELLETAKRKVEEMIEN